jgi:hypothetical protein
MVLVAAFVLSACNKGDGGAVSFRWRLIDKGTKDRAGSGRIYDPGEFVGEDGACACDGRNDGRCTGVSWSVTRVKLEVRDPKTLQVPPEVLDGDVTFPCRQREATTPFIVPTRENGEPWALSLRAFDPAAPPGTPDQGSTPAPDVRFVPPAEIVNLDVIEISVRATTVP